MAHSVGDLALDQMQQQPDRQQLRQLGKQPQPARLPPVSEIQLTGMTTPIPKLCLLLVGWWLVEMLRLTVETTVLPVHTTYIEVTITAIQKNVRNLTRN